MNVGFTAQKNSQNYNLKNNSNKQVGFGELCIHIQDHNPDKPADFLELKNNVRKFLATEKGQIVQDKEKISVGNALIVIKPNEEQEKELANKLINTFPVKVVYTKPEFSQLGTRLISDSARSVFEYMKSVIGVS